MRRRAEGGGGLSELLSGLAEPAESREWRVRILHPDFKGLGAQVGGWGLLTVSEGMFFYLCQHVHPAPRLQGAWRAGGGWGGGGVAHCQARHGVIVLLPVKSQHVHPALRLPGAGRQVGGVSCGESQSQKDQQQSCAQLAECKQQLAGYNMSILILRYIGFFTAGLCTRFPYAVRATAVLWVLPNVRRQWGEGATPTANPYLAFITRPPSIHSAPTPPEGAVRLL